MALQATAFILVIGGGFFLGLALKPIFRIVNILPKGNLQNQWKVLGAFVVLFMLGYFAYAIETWFLTPSYLVPSIFFFGGLFVLLVANLSEKTAKDLSKISILTKESTTDVLMGIYNRRYFERHFNKEVELCLSGSKKSLSLIIIDADNFKKFNDTYGHQIGDKILKSLADKIKSLARKNDIIARYGGEEICIIVPCCQKDETMRFAERLRSKIASDSIATCAALQEEIFMQVSIGVATWKAGESAKYLLSKADKALYFAKKNGRNCVIHADML